MIVSSRIFEKHHGSSHSKDPLASPTSLNYRTQYRLEMLMKIKLKTPTAVEPANVDRVGSVRTFLDALVKFDRPEDAIYYYRGHESFTYELKPTIYRDANLIQNEDVIFKELILRCPNDFAAMTSTFQTLVKMQHYALPTRLLDLTTNPLIAL